MNNNEYNYLVEKLAEEIIGGVIEKEAGVKEMLASGRALGEKGINAIKTLSGKALSAGKGAVGTGISKFQNMHPAVAAGIGVPTGVGGTLAFDNFKNRDKDEEDLARKAAEALEDGMAKMAASEEVYEHGMAEVDAAVAILEELGIDVNDLIGE